MQLKWTDLAGTDLEKIEAYCARCKTAFIASSCINNVYRLKPIHAYKIVESYALISKLCVLTTFPALVKIAST